MARLFQEAQINGMQLKNRFVRSATWEGMALEDGSCTPRLAGMMAGRAHRASLGGKEEENYGPEGTAPERSG